MQRILLPFGLWVIWMLSGCDGAEEPVPAYLHIDQPTFAVPNPTVQGSNSNEITYAFVTINGTFRGYYELPVEIPVLASGVQRINISPAVSVNENPNIIEIYRMYEPYVDTLLFEAGATTVVKPRFSYYADPSVLTFPFLEDFEDGNHDFLIDFFFESSDDLQLTSDPAVAFEGTSAFIEVDTAQPTNGVISETALLSLPDKGQSVFMELDYKSDTRTQVALFSFGSATGLAGPVLNLPITNGAWRKVYFDLAQIIRDQRQAGGEFFLVYLGAVLLQDSESGDLRLQGRSYFDNVKIVYTNN